MYEKPINEKWCRVSPDHPHACKANRGAGAPCPFRAVFNPRTGDWTDYCPRHSAIHQIHAQNAADEALYNVAKWEGKILRMQKHPHSKSISAELAVLRMLLEQKLKHYNNEAELMMASGSLSDLILKIEKLVKTLNNIDRQNNLFMDREQVEALANSFIQIVTQYVPDNDTIEAIMSDVQEAMSDAAKPTRNIQGATPSGTLPDND